MERVDYQPVVVQDIVNMHRSDELDIDPWYQRRSVWTRAQKAYLINTLFERKPVPSLYIRHYLDIESEKSIKEVVDGQQRIRSILEFANGEFTARHPDSKRRVLYKQLTPEMRHRFLMTQLSVGYLIDADDSDVIEIFGRLNSVAKTLNTQEKRNARFSGEYKQFCLRQAAARVALWRDLHVFSANAISRMDEVQFVSDIVLNLAKGLSDFSAANLDRAYQQWDEDFPLADDVEKRLGRIFDFVSQLEPTSIRDTIFSRSPVFFSLMLVLDQWPKLSRSRAQAAIFEVDARFNSDLPIADRPKSDADFYLACTSSTQRIRMRRIRDRYLKNWFK